MFGCCSDRQREAGGLHKLPLQEVRMRPDGSEVKLQEGDKKKYLNI
jgi:hypothetical protein